MKYGKNPLLCILFVMFFGNAIIQNVKFTEMTPTVIKEMESKKENQLRVISFSNKSGELIFDKGDGKEIIKIVKLDDLDLYYTKEIGENLYFFKRIFEKGILTYTGVKYDMETFKLGTPKTVMSINSKSDPEYYAGGILI